MKFSKVIGLIIGVIQLASAVGLIVGMHAMLGVYSSAFPGGEQGIEIEFSDPVIVPFVLTPRNSGYVDASVDVSVGMIVEGKLVASESVSVIVPSGSTVPVEIELSIPLEEAELYFHEGVDLEWDTDITVTTLFDLISFRNHMIIEGGAM